MGHVYAVKKKKKLFLFLYIPKIWHVNWGVCSFPTHHCSKAETFGPSADLNHVLSAFATALFQLVHLRASFESAVEIFLTSKAISCVSHTQIKREHFRWSSRLKERSKLFVTFSV